MIDVKLETKKLKTIDDNSIIIVVLKTKKSFELLGCDCCDWVIDAVKKHSYAVVDYDGGDIVDIAKKSTFSSKYVMFLTSNMPLLTENDIDRLIEYCLIKRVKACKFWGGAVFESEYISKTTSVFYDSVYTQNEENFYIVENAAQRKHAHEVLRNRIIDFHLGKGVDIKNCKNVVIEKNVVIGTGTTVYGGNTIKGNSAVCKNVILKENNIIVDSLLGDNSCVSSCVVENSKIGRDTIVMPYCNIKNCEIGNNVIVSANTSIENKKIKDNRKI